MLTGDVNEGMASPIRDNLNKQCILTRIQIIIIMIMIIIDTCSLICNEIREKVVGR